MDDAIFGLRGKNALVIGGGQGMGESVCRLLADVGCNLAILDFDGHRAERVAGEARTRGVHAAAIAADVTDDEQMRVAIAESVHALGSVDCLVAIVGMASWSRLIDLTGEEWDSDHRRNLRYFFIAAQDVAKRWIDAGASGTIVALTSVDGLQSAPFHAAYGAAKAGIINLVKSMAAEWSRHGIRVNAVAPGTIVTPRIPLRAPSDELEATRTIPAQRRGTVEEVAKAVLFLSSDLSSYVSGQTLAVDGGYTAVGPIGYEGVLERVGGAGTLGISARESSRESDARRSHETP